MEVDVHEGQCYALNGGTCDEAARGDPSVRSHPRWRWSVGCRAVGRTRRRRDGRRASCQPSPSGASRSRWLIRQPIEGLRDRRFELVRSEARRVLYLWELCAGVFCPFPCARTMCGPPPSCGGSEWSARRTAFHDSQTRCAIGSVNRCTLTAAKSARTARCGTIPRATLTFFVERWRSSTP